MEKLIGSISLIKKNITIIQIYKIINLDRIQLDHIDQYFCVQKVFRKAPPILIKTPDNI